MHAAAADRVLGLLADAEQRVAQRAIARRGIEGAVDLDRGVARCLLAHMLAHRREFGVEQDRRFELQDVHLRLLLGEDVAEIAEARLQRHHPPLAQRIDRRVGHLAEILPEEVVRGRDSGPRARRSACRRPSSPPLLALFGHGLEDQLEILHRPAGLKLALAQLVAIECCGCRAAHPGSSSSSAMILVTQSPNGRCSASQSLISRSL